MSQLISIRLFRNTTDLRRLARLPSICCLLGAMGIWAGFNSAALSQEPAETESQRIERFQKFLSGVKLKGHFTIRGRESGQLSEEEYFILKAEKGSDGDYWMITARIKYGGKDLTVPMPLEIKWAGNTPVITVDNLAIPGMGTFDARVVIRPDAYAGTWQHDDVGGHLFGTIEKMTQEELDEMLKSRQRQRSDDGGGR